MANTCSFIISDKNYVDYQCFQPLTNEMVEPQFIIIEVGSKTQYFTENEIAEYLNDICLEWGTTWEFNEKEERYEINTFPIKGVLKRKAFFMAVRFIWENDLRDKFIKVVKHYVNIKNLFPDFTTMEKLCLSVNSYLTEIENRKFNGNHFFISLPYVSNGDKDKHVWCKMIKSEDDMSSKINSANTFFYNYVIKKWDYINKKPELFTIEDYQYILNHLEYEGNPVPSLT